MLTQQIPEIQEQLKRLDLAGWLLYDFRGSNPIAAAALGIDVAVHTRRLFYLIPASGVPVMIYHDLDGQSLPALPGRHVRYIGWRDLEQLLSQVLQKAARKRAPRFAMEYFPGATLPHLSRLDAGTMEWLTQMEIEVVSSVDLVQHFLGRLNDAQGAAHREAALALDEIKNDAFRLVRERLAAGRRILEFELQQFVMEALSRVGMVSDYPPVVASGRNSANPHYLPSPESPAEIGANEVLLLDLLGRHDRPVCAYADITWVAFTGADAPATVREIFELVLRARDAGLGLVESRYDSATGVGPCGWEVDREIRQLIELAGYGRRFPHRAGHSLGTSRGHGHGANIDDLETHDTRQLVQGTCFSLKPGIYLEDFGIRSEVDVYLDQDGPVVSSPLQRELVLLS